MSQPTKAQQDFENFALAIMEKTTEKNKVEMCKRMWRLKAEYFPGFSRKTIEDGRYFTTDYCPMCKIYDEYCTDCPLLESNGEICCIEWRRVVGFLGFPHTRTEFNAAFTALHDRIMAIPDTEVEA